jgi:threonine synthase
VNLPKALRALDQCGGVVRDATDQEILDAKAKVGAGGFGCEPASAASVAGARKLLRDGTIAADERVVCVLTGHVLKDPEAAFRPEGLVEIEPTVAAVEAALARSNASTVIVPGHGAVSNRAPLAAYRDMLVAVGRKVRAAV